MLHPLIRKSIEQISVNHYRYDLHIMEILLNDGRLIEKDIS